MNSVSDTPSNQQLELSEVKRQLQRYETRLEQYQSRQPERADPNAVDLRELWNILVRRRVAIAVVVCAFLLGSIAVTLLMTPTYRATTVIQIELESADVIDYTDVTQDESSASSKDFYQTQYELLQSRSIARRVIDTLGLSKSQIIGSTKGNFSARLELSRLKSLLWPDEAAPPADLESLFLDQLSIEPVRNSRLVRVHYEHENPEMAADIANAIAAAYIDMSLNRRFEASSYAKTFLAERIKQARADLEDSERALMQYTDERGIIDQNDKLGILMDKLRSLNASQVEAESSRIQAEAAYQEMLNAPADSLAQALNNELVQRLKERRSQLKAQYQERLKIYKPSYPSMLQLEQEIGQVEEDIQHEVDALRDGVRIRYQAKLREESKLNDSIELTKTDIRNLNARSTEFQVLKREVNTNRELYDGLLQRMKEVGVVAGIASNNISVVDNAQVPFEKHSPRILVNIAIALLLGLVGGISLALLLESLDDTIKTGEDLERILNLPVLGVTPRLDQQNLSSAKIALMSHLEPSSALAESHRTMRTALSLSSSEGAPKVLHFTSVSPGEGKTTTAVNTAINFAQTGSCVLLIDADLRNPSLHKIFNCPNDTGLSNYLTGAAEPGKATKATGINNIFVMPSGPVPPNPAELLHGARMIDLAALAAERFDYVIIDGPPLMGLADAMLLADIAKATLLVVAAHVAHRGGIESGMKRLHHSRANVLGAVLAKFDMARTAYGYGYGYNYQYTYSYGHRQLEQEAGA